MCVGCGYVMVSSSFVCYSLISDLRFALVNLEM